MIDAATSVRYDFTLNGYSLIPSWWRDRPDETQQPANDAFENGYMLKRA